MRRDTRTWQGKYEIALAQVAEAEQRASDAWDVADRLEKENADLRRELEACRLEIKSVADMMDPAGTETDNE